MRPGDIGRCRAKVAPPPSHARSLHAGHNKLESVATGGPKIPVYRCCLVGSFSWFRGPISVPRYSWIVGSACRFAPSRRHYYPNGNDAKETPGPRWRNWVLMMKGRKMTAQSKAAGGVSSLRPPSSSSHDRLPFMRLHTTTAPEWD